MKKLLLIKLYKHALVIISLFFCYKSFAVIHEQGFHNEAKERSSWLTGYNISLSLLKLNMAGNETNHYQDLYGSTNLSPALDVMYKIYSSPYFNIGTGCKLGMYSAEGNVAASRPANDDPVSKGEQKTDFSMSPYQFFVRAQLSPFSARYVVLDLWAGYEELYFEEVRNDSLTNSTQTNSSNKASPTSQKLYLNSGWSKSVVYGIGLNFLLNFFEETAVNSANRSFGIRYIYVTPYMEIVTSIKGGKNFISQKQSEEKIDFSRTNFGLSFVFES